MNGPSIDFRNIRPLDGGQREGFEELCCHIFAQADERPEGARYHRLRGAGGDGGVEAIWDNEKGNIWGLQSKWFWKLQSPEKAQIQNSLLQAVAAYPDLKHYTICLPMVPTGPGAGGKGKDNQLALLKKWRTEWEALPELKGRKVEIDWWDGSALASRLSAIDKTGGRTRYWFDKELLTRDWFHKQLKEATVRAGKRYTPELNVRVPISEAFDAFEGENLWKERTSELHEQLRDIGDRWRDHVNDGYSARDSAVPAFPPELSGTATALSDLVDQLVSDLERISDDESTEGTLAQAFDRVKHASDAAAECESVLKADLERKHGRGTDTPGFRQFEAEYNVRFPAANLDSARDLRKMLEKVRDFLDAPLCRLAISKRMLVTGPSGVGKTHAVVDRAWSRFSSGKLSVVLFGGSFGTEEAWVAISGSLGFSANTSRAHLFAMLDEAAQVSGAPLVIFIDALNETSPDRRKWQDWLPSLYTEIDENPHLLLCMSCRDIFLKEVLPDADNSPRFVHNGFLGREFDACRSFFEYYHLPVASTPLLQPEFSNPLFLHIYCQGAAEPHYPASRVHHIGLSEVIDRYLAAKNRAIATALDYDAREPRVRRAVEAIAHSFAASGERRLPLSDVRRVVEALYPAATCSSSLFDHLESEGILSAVEPEPGTSATYSVQFSFERLYDHFAANTLLSGIEREAVAACFGPSGGLHFAVADEECVKQNIGILEALSILLPERFRVELLDLIEPRLREVAYPAFLSGLRWRAAEDIDQRTLTFTTQAFTVGSVAVEAAKTVLQLAVKPGHHLNAEYLGRFLKRLPYALRDGFWAHVLHESFEDKSIVYQLIDWACRARLDDLSAQAVALWGTTLAWFCASPNRRVRDKSTRGLVRLLKSCPSAVSIMWSEIGDCGDDYVIERSLLSIYGALLLNPDRHVLKQMTCLFEAYIQEDQPRNALIRDHIRLIAELAVAEGAIKGPVNPKLIPPFESPWPLTFPDETVVAPYLDEKQHIPGHMTEDIDAGLGSDFARYIVHPRLVTAFDFASAPLDVRGMYRWFLMSAIDFGYPGGPNKTAARYDYTMLRDYGGGRGRPGWAERLGKKYYWILLQRLVGQVADHLPRKAYWERTPSQLTPATDLQGIDLRDIDPTDLRLTEDPDAYYARAKWMPSNPYKKVAAKTPDDDWVIVDDLADAHGALSSTLLGDREALVVSEFVSWRTYGENGKEYPYRTVARSITSVFLTAKELARFTDALKRNDCNPDIHQFEPHDYKGFLGEYPNGFAYTRQTHRLDFFDSQNVCGFQVFPTLIEQLKGREWGYDYSDDHNSQNLMMPAPGVVNFGKLRWDGDRGWRDSSGKCIAQAYTSSGGSNALIVEKDYLVRYLKLTRQALVWFVYEDKMVIHGTAGRDFSGSIEKRSAYSLTSGRIKVIGQHVEVREAMDKPDPADDEASGK